MVRAILLREEIEIPKNVNVSIEGNIIRVKGPKGELKRDLSIPISKGILVTLQDQKIILEATFADRRKKALFYTTLAHLNNMIVGVTKGFRYYLKIIYTHFPISVKVVGNEVQISNLIGEKNIRRAKIEEGVKVSVKGDEVIVEGIDLEKVALTAARIEQATKISGFDRRVFSDGIYIYKKEVIS
ncbi:MAG: 50S ribosomal protein L6 [Sulfolobaceae archaeon]